MIVDLVISHNGDILKFAGDALFAEWRVVTQEGEDNSINTIATIEDCVLIAATCGAKVVAECSDHPIYSTTGLQINALNVHCGLGVGELTSAHVGNYHTRRELLVLGDPIDQVSKAEGAASLGEIVASPEALSSLSKTCYLNNVSTLTLEPCMIACRKSQYFVPKQEDEHISQISKVFIKSFNFEGMDTTALGHLQRKIALYVHPIVVQNDTNNNSLNLYRPFTPLRPQAEAERYRAEAEKRSVYTLFLIADICTEDKNIFPLLNDIMNLVTDTLESFMGHLRQFIVDDKGVVLIATFGLRGSSTPNMLTERAIPATRFLHRTLKSELGVDNRIGGTIGSAYCGVVGGNFRHEYAVLGPSVNLAARLMSLPKHKHPGILVDDEVRKKAGKTANFRPHDLVKAKGYSHLVPTFQPLTATERRWGAVNPYFVGRKDEMGMVLNLAKTMAQSYRAPAKMYFLVGDSGSGKSSVVVQTIAILSKGLRVSGKNIIITRNVSNEGDSHVPFSLFRSIFRDVLHELKRPDTDDSSNASNSTYSNSLFEKDWDKMSLSAASTARSENSNSLDQVNYLSKEIGAPKGFLEIVGHHLLGHTKVDEGKGKSAKMDEIVNVMARAFARCTNHAHLIVLAMDDVHNVDRMSWKVVRQLFETCDNLLIFCGSRPFTSYPPKIEKGFWTKLNDQYKKQTRFHKAELGPLKQCDITEMISKSFDCSAKEIDGTLSKDVFVQSGGMPFYTSEILTNITRQRMCERLENGKMGWRRTADTNLEPPATYIAFASLDELIVNRIDSLGEGVREILIIAATLGAAFELSELVSVYQQTYTISLSDRESAYNRVCDTVELALKENILEESFDLENSDAPNDFNDYEISLDNIHAKFENQSRFEIRPSNSNPKADVDDVCFENKQYRFYHDTWRRNILALLLDSRKRDIHRNAALALEMRCQDEEKTDYRSKIQLFGYWKESGDSSKAAELALEIGKKFSSLCLNADSIDIYTNALTMWQRNADVGEELVCGFPIQVIDSIDAKTCKNIVLLFIAKGQTLANLNNKEGVTAYESALKISRTKPLSNNDQDRSFIFPIFSGMLVFLKNGSIVEPQNEISYEQELVANFILEAKQRGIPIVHYLRALAMEVDFYCLAGQYERGLASHFVLEDIYSVEEHHALMIQHYHSDRAAQSFGNCARCYCLLGNIEKALKVCHHVVANLMPIMDVTSTHGNVVLLYPILWIWKDNNLAAEALSAFRKFILTAFKENFGEGATTPTLAFFKPIEMLFDIYINDLSKEVIQEYITWVRDTDTYTWIPGTINKFMLRLSRCGNSIFAEIFLLLSKLCDNEELRNDLIIEGLEHACIALECAEGKNGSPKHQSAYDQIKPVYDQLSGSKKADSTFLRRLSATLISASPMV